MNPTIPDPQQSARCMKCGGTMEPGFIIDQSRGGPIAPSWMSGEPEQGFFGPKTSGRDAHAVQTFRCVSCGYLESFAPQVAPVVAEAEEVRRTFESVFPPTSTDQSG